MHKMGKKCRNSLFSFLATDAIHSENEMRLDDKSCLAAASRLFYKRWLHKYHHHFVGVAHELKALMDEWDKVKVEFELAQKILYEKSTPLIPKFGRIWKKLNRSSKKKLMIGHPKHH